MREYHAGVEFLDEPDARTEPVEPDDGGGRRWRTRAVIFGVGALVLVASALIHGAGRTAGRASPDITRRAAVPRLTCGDILRMPVSDVAVAITRTTTRALPGIRISDAVADVACLGVEGWLLRPRSLDARYKRLLITVDISAGTPASGTTVQIVDSGASIGYIIHNRPQSARRTVTVTAIAPHGANIPVPRLRRIADQLARLPGLERRSAHFSRAKVPTSALSCKPLHFSNSC